MTTEDLIGIPPQTIYIACIVIVALAFIVIKFMPKKNSTGGSSRGKEPRNLQQYVNAVNELINRYNNIRDTFILASQEKRESILKCEDTESLERLGEIMQGFDMSAGDAEDMINSIKDELHEGRAPLDRYRKLSNDIEMMEQQMQDMKGIMPTEHEHDWNAGKEGRSNIQAASDDGIDSYFHGCNTKEELTKRYRALCKVFHPDAATGDTDEFRKLQEAYEDMMNKMR